MSKTDLSKLAAKVGGLKTPAAKKRVVKKKAAKKKVARKKVVAKKPAAKKGAPKGHPKYGGCEFPVGNRFWECRAKHGRNGIWANSEDLLRDCLGYFQWLDENPLQEQKGFAFQGAVTKESFNKMRAATLNGLELYLGIAHNTWLNYRAKPDFLHVVEYVEKAIYEQKFTGAAADLLNPNIIARDLGLKDTVNNQVTGEDGGPVEVVERRIVRPRNGNR